MKWDPSSIDQYMDKKKYFDTALIPFVRIQLGSQTKKSIIESASLIKVAHAIEDLLQGRLMLFPCCSYHLEDNIEQEQLKAQPHSRYVQALQEDGFHHIFILSFDKDLRHMSIMENVHHLSIISTGAEEEQSMKACQGFAQHFMKEIISFWK